MKSSFMMRVLADAHRKCGHIDYANSLDQQAENFEVIEEAQEISNGDFKKKRD